MNLTQFSKILFRYLIWAGIPYYIAKKIEIWFWDKETKKKVDGTKVDGTLTDRDNPIDDATGKPIDDATGKALNTKGGALEPITAWIIKLFMEDLAVKIGVAGVFGASIWSDSADKATANIARYASSILAAPGVKLARIVKKLNKIDPEHTEDIKKILLDSSLTKEEKLEFLKLKVEYAFKNLRGKKRKHFLQVLLAIIIFLYGTNAGVFSLLLDRIRAFLGREDDEETVREYLIELYREFNAPLPEELVTKISD